MIRDTLAGTNPVRRAAPEDVPAHRTFEERGLAMVLHKKVGSGRVSRLNRLGSRNSDS